MPRRRSTMGLGHVVLGLLGLCWTFAASALVAIPELHAPVTDLTDALDANARGALQARLEAFAHEKGGQVAVLIVPSTQPETIEQYSIRVVDAWKLGRAEQDDGVLLLVARDDHAVRIEVGRGLEGNIPDAVANRIIDELIVPRFRAGDFAGGIDAGLGRILALASGEAAAAETPDDASGSWAVDEPRGASPDAQALVTPRVRPPPDYTLQYILGGFAAFAVLLALIVFSAFARRWLMLPFMAALISGLLGALAMGPLSGLIGEAATHAALPYLFGGLFVLLLPLLLFAGSRLGSSLDGGSYGGGDFSSTSSPDWSSSSSSASDSYSGGGGSFSGGGASGSW